LKKLKKCKHLFNDEKKILDNLKDDEIKINLDKKKINSQKILFYFFIKSN
jgi:hypothetical protein